MRNGIGNKLTVSVKMLTYKHEAFIKQAIESVLMQKTDFEYNLIIADDCSPDRTSEIINKIIKTHPKGNRIKYFRHEENIGMQRNGIFAFSKCTGKYIAFCEGDDYWTDPYKLQKQVDYLETNPDYGLVYTDIQVVDENGNALPKTPSFVRLRNAYNSGNVFFDLLNVNFLTTPTVCFRVDLFDVNEYGTKWYVYDMWMWLHVAMLSKIKYFNTITAAYRKHHGGITNEQGILAERQVHIYADVLTKFLKDKHNLSDDKNHRQIFFSKVIGVLMSKKILLKIKINLIKLLLIRGYLLSFLWWALNYKVRPVAKQL